MLLLHSSTLKIAAVAATIFLLGCGVGAFNYGLERAHLVADLIHDVKVSTVAFEPEAVHQLGAVRGDVERPQYPEIKRRLLRLKAVNPKIRYAYLIRITRNPRTAVFLGDSTAPQSPDEAWPGAPFPVPDGARGLEGVVANGEPGYDGPVRDQVGTWVMAYAEVADEKSSGRADAVDILGLHLAADDWVHDLWFSSLRAAAYAWLVLGFPVFAILSTRRHGEQREAIRNLSEAVEQSHSAILILDLEQRIEYANRGLSQQIGFSRRELIGRQWREFLVESQADPAAADLIATIRTGRPWEGEWTNRRKDGGTYPVHGMVTPVKHRDGALACFVAIFDDVSDVKRKEAELREARDLAQAGDRAKGQFLATMSHEVRTPLNGIVGFTSLLLDTSLSAEQREFVQTIRASGEALIQLTGDILDYARIESGKLKLEPIACDPRDCIEEALDLHAAKAVEKKIVLLHRAADDVPAAVVVDSGRLRQVLVNLIGNAVKFTERGEVEVFVRLLELGRTAERDVATPAGLDPPQAVCRLEFSIRDTGIGIAPEQHGRLFKPFSQLDESSTRRYGGAGLGLAICKNLVELMGGSIAMQSQPGTGTTFTFTIQVPVAISDAPDRQLEGMKLALAARPGRLREELSRLLTSWGAVLREADGPAELSGGDQDMALVEVCEHIAKDLIARGEPLTGLPAEKTLALVPISLPSELRTALRSHFRLLVNLPVHHGPLFALLSGSRPVSGSSPGRATQFGLRVLIVEDNPINQRLMQRVLGGLGCTWSVVTNGREAIDILHAGTETFDVVLLDLHMPEMDGLSALQRIRAGEAGDAVRGIWTIALTADARPEQKTKGFATGLNDYLTKPLRLGELDAALRRFVAHRQTPPPAR